MGSPSPQPEAPSPSNGRDRPNSRGDATRLRILLKAEELFAHNGIAAVPLRDIGVAAGQKNNVAVQYHFGDRDTLVREIVGLRLKHGESIRAEHLAEFAAAGRSPDIYDVVRAWMAALTCHLEPGNHYLAFLARYASERGGYAGLESGTSTYFTFTAMVRRLLPDLSEDLVAERWMVMSTSAVHTLARYQSAQRAGILPAPLPDLIEDLILFFANAVAAPAAAPTPG